MATPVFVADKVTDGRVLMPALHRLSVCLSVCQYYSVKSPQSIPRVHRRCCTHNALKTVNLRKFLGYVV